MHLLVRVILCIFRPIPVYGLPLAPFAYIFVLHRLQQASEKRNFAQLSNGTRTRLDAPAR